MQLVERSKRKVWHRVGARRWIPASIPICKPIHAQHQCQTTCLNPPHQKTGLSRVSTYQHHKPASDLQRKEDCRQGMWEVYWGSLPHYCYWFCDTPKLWQEPFVFVTRHSASFGAQYTTNKPSWWVSMVCNRRFWDCFVSGFLGFRCSFCCCWFFTCKHWEIFSIHNTELLPFLQQVPISPSVRNKHVIQTLHQHTNILYC